MLNKNDPLIGAVQQVMQQSNAEREATRLVNEAFGVEDRKALPHEYQAEWNSVYQQVLAEATHPSKYSKKQRDFAATAGDPTTIDSADLAHVRKHGGKHIGEEQIDEKTIAKKKAKKGTNYKVQATDSDREGSKITFRHGKRIKDEGDYDRGAGAFFMKKGTYGSAEDMLKTVKEEIAYNLAEQAEYVYENYGEEGFVEFIDSLTEEQFELLSMLESAGLPGGAAEFFQKKARREAAQKASQNKGSDPTNTPGGARAGYTAPRGADPTNTPSGQRAGAAPKPANLDAKAPGMGGPNYNPNKGLDAKAPGMGGPNYVPNKGVNKVAPKPKPKPVGAAPKVAAPKAKAPKAIAPQPKKKLTFFQKSELARSRKNDTMDQTRNLERRYGVRAPMKKAKKSVFEEQIQNAIAEAMSPSAGAQGGVNAASIQQQKAAVMQKRKDLGTSVMSGRVGDPGKQNFIQNARAQKEREKAAGGDGTKYLPVPPNVQQAIRNNQPQPGRPQTLSPGANPPVSKNMGGGGGDYRRAQSSPIKVSDTEVMNDPKFKKALSSVGGTQAAKKIQTGERVSGLGRMNKGDTIMSRVRTDIAARKNVGRES